jgi:hypothetical protein
MSKKTNDGFSKIAKRTKRAYLARLVRNITIGFAVLLIVSVMVGLAYIWYVDQNSNVNNSNVTTHSKTTMPIAATPTSPAANAKEGVSIQSITSPLMPGSNASVTVKTNQYSKCTITVVYNKVPSTDSGLTTKTADEYGMATWSWTVEGTAPIGKWPVTVTCMWNGRSAVVIGDLVITKQTN